MEAEYLLFCAGRSTDDNGNLSLHGIFEMIYAAGFPVQHKPFDVVFKLKANKAVINQDVQLKILVEKDNKEINKLEAGGKFTIEKGNSLVPAFDVSQFVYPEPGTYHVKLYVDNKLLMTRPLHIKSTDELTEK